MTNSDDAPPHEAEADEKPPSSLSQALRVVEQSDAVTGRPRQIFSAGLLGTCVVFVATMLALPRLDTALHVALFAFAVAMPLLALEFLASSVEFKPGPAAFVARALQDATWLVAEVLGGIAVYVGIVAAIWHLSAPVGITFALCTLIAPLAIMFAALAGLFTDAWRKEKAHKRTT